MIFGYQILLFTVSWNTLAAGDSTPPSHQPPARLDCALHSFPLQRKTSELYPRPTQIIIPTQLHPRPSADSFSLRSLPTMDPDALTQAPLITNTGRKTVPYEPAPAMSASS